jgi:hypothetical protein
MRTDHLVRAIVADNRTSAISPGTALCCALVPATLFAAALLLATLGLRPRFVEALAAEPRFGFKIMLSGSLAVAAAALAVRLARPGTDPRRAAALVLAVPVLLACADVAEMLLVPAADWGRRLVGSNALACLRSIPFLAAVPLVAALGALRNGAPEHPGLAGASAGLVAGGIGAALYATHCFDDSPLFVSVWYTTAILIVTLVGAWCGSRLLRW